MMRFESNCCYRSFENAMPSRGLLTHREFIVVPIAMMDIKTECCLLPVCCQCHLFHVRFQRISIIVILGAAPWRRYLLSTRILLPFRSWNILQNMDRVILNLVSIRRNSSRILKAYCLQSYGIGVYYAFLGQIIRDKYVVLARVRHSQRVNVNDPRVQFSNQTVLPGFLWGTKTSLEFFEQLLHGLYLRTHILNVSCIFDPWRLLSLVRPLLRRNAE